MPMKSLLGPAAVLLAMSSTIAAGEIIDRVLAIVGGQIITLSDARAAARLALVPLEPDSDPAAGALNRLIDRRLMLVEIERYAPPEPSAAALDEALAAVRQRFHDPLAFEAALEETSMSHDQLRRFIRDTLRIESYQQQRFGSMVQPSEEELVRYYRDQPDAFSAGGVTPPFQSVREEVRARLIEERRAVLVKEWLDGLRRRGDVVVLYLPAG
jgi:hypothetical protein